MKPLDTRTRQHIIDILTPLIATESERRALLILALFDHPLLNQLDYTGSTQTFIANLIDKLFQFGKLDDGRPALWAVMETAREQVGLDRKHLIDALRPAFELPPPPRRDRIFISYSRKNEREAQRIVSNLKDAGLRVWYDREKIKAGTEWWASIERGILNADYFVFCLSTASIRSKVARDELLTARRNNKPIFAIMLEDSLGELYDKEFAEREGFAEIGWLPSLHIINFTQPDRYGDSLRELIQSLPGYALPDGYYLEQINPRDLPNPFRGLEAFLEVDAPYFAGREDAVQEILTHLRDVSKPRLLAVVGASGSGKSSLVQAGVIPALRRELPFWETLTIKPGSTPLNELADRLQERLGADTEQTRERLRGQITAIDDIASELMQGKPDDARFVLVIDQFEELFTLTGDDERQHVLERLLYAVNQPNGRVQILLTMRADFFDYLSTVPELARLVRENLDIATEMTPDQLRRSIERPARQVGVRYEDGLVEQILEDVRSQPGSLPLLQYALKELFERKIGRRMTLEAYDAIKGVKGALATRAEAIYTALSPAEQDALRRILLRLVEVGEDTVSRRRVLRSDLSFTGIADETVQRVLDRLTASEARLLVVSAPVDDNDPTNDGQIFYEVSHEALLTHWKRLEAWIAENRSDLRLSSDILTLARVWDGTGRADTSYLLMGGRLLAAQEWLERGDATSLQSAFVEASILYRQAEIERLERLKKEAENATRRAIQQRRLARIVVIVATVLLVVATGTGLFALFQTSIADQRINELNAIAPGATQGALWREWVNTEDQDERVRFLAWAGLGDVSHNEQWVPVEHQFDGVVMVLVPSGCFTMGSNTSESTKPLHQNCLDEPFWIDKTEVTQSDFNRLGGKKLQPNEYNGGQLPVDTINWFEALDFCQIRGGRLPSEMEWEYAARGPDSWEWPWGNDGVSGGVGFHERGHVSTEASSASTSPVGSFPAGASWVGALDMAGNVLEWTNTIYNQAEFPYPYSPIDGRENTERIDAKRVLRGDFWMPYSINGKFVLLSSDTRWSLEQTSATFLGQRRERKNTVFEFGGFNVSIGFRCLRSYL